MLIYELNGRHLTFQDIREIVAGRGTSFGSFVESFVAYTYESCVVSGDVVIDGGAARGWHTFGLAKQVGPTGLVHAVEPLPENCDFLRTRAKQWQYQNSVIVHEVALGNEHGMTQFHRVVEDPGLSGIKRAWVPASATIEIIHVPIRQIEEIVGMEDWKRLSFIKLDLEGGEFIALKCGAKNIMNYARPVIALESGRINAAKLYEYSEDDFFEFFDDLGYELFDIFGKPFTRDIFAMRDAPSEFVAVPSEKRSLKLNEKLRNRLDEFLG